MNTDGQITDLKIKILNGDFSFIDVILGIVKKNKVLYSDNYGNLNKEEINAVSYLEPFMHLLYRGSKHSKFNSCESGFIRIVNYNNINLKFKYYDGPFTFVTVEIVEEVKNMKQLITMDLLQERLREAEDVKSELAPIIEKYLKAGLTFEEITKMFVEIMKENRISL